MILYECAECGRKYEVPEATARPAYACNDCLGVVRPVEQHYA